MRVPNGFFGSRDFPYLNLGIQDFLSKMGVRYGRIESIAVSRMPKKKTSGLRDCTKFGIAIAGLKNPLGDLQCSASFVFHEER